MRTKRVKQETKVATIVPADTYKIQLIRALNDASVELDSSMKKDMALQYMKMNDISTRGINGLAESEFRMIGTLAYIHSQVLELNDQDLARLHRLCSDLVRSNAKIEPEITSVVQAEVRPTLSIRDKMSIKAEKFMIELDQAIDDLIAGEQSDFNISRWIAANEIPGKMCKVIAEKLDRVMKDFELVIAKDPDYVEAYSFITPSRRKLIFNQLQNIFSTLTNHKTIKVAKPITKRQKAKQATAKFSRAVLRGKALDLMSQGKVDKDIIDLFVEQYDVKKGTAYGYVRSFRKEYDAQNAKAKSVPTTVAKADAGTKPAGTTGRAKAAKPAATKTAKVKQVKPVRSAKVKQ